MAGLPQQLQMGSLDIQCDDEKLNPLMVHTVLQKVFQYLDVQTLKSCRSVCRTWSDSSLHFMKQSCEVLLNDHIQAAVILSGQTQISRLIHFRMPVRFALNYDYYFRELMKNAPPHMETFKLTVETRGWTSTNLLNHELIYKVGRTGEFKLISFKQINPIPKEWAFSSYPNCHLLVSTLRRQQRLQRSTKELPCLQNGNFPSLEALRYYLSSPISIPDIINASPEDLKHLFIDDNTTYENLFPHMVKLANTLETLQIHLSYLCEGGRMAKLPSFRKLLRLSLAKFSRWNFEIERLPEFPELTTLNLSRANLIKMPMDLAKRIFPKLNNLEFEECYIRTDFIDRIQEGFPHLRRLDARTGINDEEFSRICLCLKTLEELNVGQWISDAGMCGVEIHQIKALEDKINTGKYGIVLEDIRSLARTNPYIADLPNLKRLQLNTEMISDISIIYGILMCPGLTSLEIVNNSSAVSPVSLRYLAFEMNLQRLRIDRPHREYQWNLLPEFDFFMEKHPRCYATFPNVY